MTKRSYWLNHVAVAAVLLLGGSALSACDDDASDNDEPNSGTMTKLTGGKSGDAGKTGGAGKGGTSGGAGKTGETGGAGDKECDDTEKQCYSCEPTKNIEFLNACGDLTCNPYDNSKLKKLENGKVPKLP